jgi:hypothetical protein
MSQSFGRAESQARALELLKSWAEASDVAKQRGVPVLASAADLAGEVRVKESEVHALLARLLRIASEVDSHTIFVADLPRLGEFARFVADRDSGWGWGRARCEGLENSRRG